MINIMKEINMMNDKQYCASSDGRETSLDKISEMLKKRKSKGKENLELAMHGLYSMGIVRHQQPQSLAIAGTGVQKEKRLSMEATSECQTEPVAKLGKKGTFTAGFEKKENNLAVAQPVNTDTKAVLKEVFDLRRGKDAGKGTGRDPASDKCAAGAAGVLQPNSLNVAETIAKNTAKPGGFVHRESAQPRHYESNSTPVNHEEILKYHFRKWNGDHSVTIKETGTGNTLLRPSDEYVSQRLGQALKEKGESMWLLDDEPREHKNPNHNPNDGDEDD